MCGIVGFAGPGDRSILEAMNQTLFHRGPDGSGTWHQGLVHLGMRRLSVLDHEGGQQPMQAEHAVLVFNGEIYNHGEIRAELEQRGRRFRSDHSDTETVLQAYLEWGIDCVQRFNGMWALAIFDQKNQQIWCSRDRFGQKPLFYTQQKGLFAFASELTALGRHPQLTSSLSQLAVAKYFAYGYIPAPHSIYEDVYKLPGGCHLLFDLRSGEIQVKRYWVFELKPERGRTLEQWSDVFLERFDRAVAMRLVADVPVGVFLSGGLDSSMVAASAVRVHEDLHSFSMGFEEKSFDESDYAAYAASQLGTNHHSSKLQNREARALAEPCQIAWMSPWAMDRSYPPMRWPNTHEDMWLWPWAETARMN